MPSTKKTTAKKSTKSRTTRSTAKKSTAKKSVKAKKPVAKKKVAKKVAPRKTVKAKPKVVSRIIEPRKTIVLQTNSDHGSFMKHEPRQVGLYKNIAVGFFVVTVILFAAIFFTSVRRATINLTYVPELFTYADVIQLAPERVNENTVAGTVETREVNLANRYIPEGRQQVEVSVSGKVRIINNYTKDQPLVKTTRLLSPEGKLYRLKNSVVVPAGEVLEDVEVYADQDGAEFAIEPTTFTIPGLWEPIQKKIYAESDKAFRGGLIEIGVISPEDMQEAEADLRKHLIDYATNLIEEEELEES